MKNFKEWCLEHKKYEMLIAYENADNEYSSNKIGFSSTKMVNWKCSKCGSKWSLPNCKMIERKTACLYCSHKKASSFYNLKTEIPVLSNEWNYEKNENKLPENFLPSSKEKVWWKCENGHEWQAIIADRVRSTKTNISNNKPICPYCNHKKVSASYNLVTEFPDIARQWNYKMNKSLIPLEVSPKSKMSVWWICEYDPTHIWQGRISNRTALNRGCPICSKNIKSSFPEQAIFYYLKLFFNDCEIGKTILGQYALDIFIESYKIIIEYDGWYYHSNSESKEREQRKDKKLHQFNIIRIKELNEYIPEIICKNNIIKYYSGGNHNNLDIVIKELLRVIEKITKVKMKYDIDCKRDYQKIRSFYYHTRKANSLAVKMPDLAKEWSNNNDRTSDNVTLGSSYKAKWICPKCNREYVSTIANRTRLHSSCPFCANRKLCKENSLEYCSPQVAKEWNYEKNGDLLPKDVIVGTDKKVWWKCGNGHEWQAMIYSRVRGSGCPYCKGLKVSSLNSLAINRKDLLEYWDYEKNNLIPEDISIGSNKYVWWKCKNGHKWQMSVNQMRMINNKVKCPYCRNIKLSSDNSLVSKYKDLSLQWNYVRNENKLPENFLPSSKEKVWWKCENGHEWQAMIYSRVRGSGCPYCKGLKVSSLNSLAINRKDLLKEWNYERNYLMPKDISTGSGKKVWWKCKSGHEWQDSVAHRTSGRGCPYCSGRRVTLENSIVVTQSNLLKEWNYEKNVDLRPEQVSKSSTKKVWWKCKNGHEWQAIIANRSRGQNCPLCWKERHNKKK